MLDFLGIYHFIHRIICPVRQDKRVLDINSRGWSASPRNDDPGEIQLYADASNSGVLRYNSSNSRAFNPVFSLWIIQSHGIYHRSKNKTCTASLERDR